MRLVDRRNAPLPPRERNGLEDAMDKRGWYGVNRPVHTHRASKPLDYIIHAYPQFPPSDPGKGRIDEQRNSTRTAECRPECEGRIYYSASAHTSRYSRSDQYRMVAIWLALFWHSNFIFYLCTVNMSLMAKHYKRLLIARGNLNCVFSYESRINFYSIINTFFIFQGRTTAYVIIR